MNKLHLLIKLTIFSILVLSLSSCEQAPKQNTKSDTITVLYPGGDERIFGPAWDENPKKLLFEPLAGFKRRWCSDEITSGLAESIVASDDQRTWTVSLRKNIKWHDGVPVTAHDIKFTLDLWRHPDVQYYAGWQYDKFTIIDDYTFRVTYDKPSRVLLGGWDVFYPKHLLKDLPPKNFRSWKFWSQPVGNGPYRFKQSIHQTMVELSANPDYYRGAPKIERYIIKFGASGSTGLNELKGGSVDVINPMNPIMAIDVMQDDRFGKDFHVSAAKNQINWNHRNPLFSDKRVRRALTHAIDRRALHKILQLPSDLPLTDSPYTTCQFADKEFPPALAFDQERAMNLMDEAGWYLPKGETIRSKDGIAFQFTMLAGQGDKSKAAVFIQSQLSLIGVEMAILPLDGGVLRERQTSGDFDAAIIHFGGSVRYHHATLFGQDSFLGFHNADIRRIYSELSNAASQEDWDQGYERMAPIFIDEIPVTFLYSRVFVTLHDKRIKGIDNDPFYDAHKIEIEEK